MHNRKISIKSFDDKASKNFEFYVKKINKGPNLTLVIMLEYQKMYFFDKVYTPNQSKEVFVIEEFKNTVPLSNVPSNFDGEEVNGSFDEKKSKRQIKQNLGYKKIIE